MKAIPATAPSTISDFLSRACGALRKAVHAIRAVMGVHALPGRGDEELALAADHVACDADAFRRAADAGLLTQALQLYRGELMPGFHLSACAEFDRWLAVYSK